MAEKRMFAKTIVDSDAFMDMPQSSQLLYFYLSMRGDDDGFINKPKTVMRMAGCKDDDLKILIAKKFIIPFESGIVVIKHWKIHNYIAKDRYTETKYKEEKSMLSLDDNKSYKLENDALYTGCIHDVVEMNTQVSIDKISKDKDKNNVQNDCTGQATKNDIDNFFEQIWKLYPNKKGKGQISDSRKKTLYQVGIEQMTVAIDRYKAELKKDDWRKQQNGSTFFHSGYIDYLDGNYEPSKSSKNNSFGINNQNDYDFDALERELQSTGGN